MLRGGGHVPFPQRQDHICRLGEEKGLLHDEGLGCTLIERLVSSVVQRKGLTPYVLVLVCIVHYMYMVLIILES